ncbi:ABC transporter substrate-binding protein [Roseomonas sp. NAR14]|uniref:Thiamine pyrimidine synthase n=1 Tax=Roseomonas acroporae TaxID=2937791 RepID=A0A9X1YEC0_9PROT|nr:ABC transporter substrate-binding protein [Roseomonas acroporae]MCK8787490.1 ABC transporter substrate-binding protein [Roseomonas acroporae]
MNRRSLLAGAAALGASGLAAPAVLAPGALAQGTAPKPIRFALDWALQGNHAMWALADDRGVFRQNGLAVRMDRGFGSGDTVVKVASGAYDIGFGDLNAAVKFNAENPDKRVVGIYVVFDRTPAAVVALKKSGIATPADLKGRKLGAPEAEASRLLFPAFARAAHVDTTGIRWTSMVPNLRDTMLVRGDVDAVTGYLFTVHFNLVGINVPESDIVSFPYAENGLDIYGNAILVRADWLERNAEAAGAFVRSSIAGLRMLMAEPDAGMAALKKRDPLFDEALEKRRWFMVRDRSILTPNVKEGGFGVTSPERTAALVRANAEAYGIANPPAPESMVTDRFLPPKAERMPG